CEDSRNGESVENAVDRYRRQGSAERQTFDAAAYVRPDKFTRATWQHIVGHCAYEQRRAQAAQRAPPCGPEQRLPTPGAHEHPHRHQEKVGDEKDWLSLPNVAPRLG